VATRTGEKRPARAPQRGLVAYLKERHDPLTSLLLTVPVFVLYHLGILAMPLRNGVDLVSQVTFELLSRSLLGYVAVTLGYAAAIAVAVQVLRRKGKIRPAELLPVLGESVLLAMLMSLLVGWTTHQLFDWQVGPHAMGPFEKLVMSAGAGFHEELVFRVGLFGGGAFALERLSRRERSERRRIGEREGLAPRPERNRSTIHRPPWSKLSATKAAWIAAVVSSLLFSAIHYVGALGDDFSLTSFTFRFLAGLFLTAVYRFRGFAVAVYTHTIYDVIVFFL
jgi:membrane protease YdiL (CAAX protease family)